MPWRAWLPLAAVVAVWVVLNLKDGADRVRRALAPGAGVTFPGSAATERAASPGTGLTPDHETGGVAYDIRGWNCGCEKQFDPDGILTWTWPCDADRPDFDDWLRKLTP